MASLRCDPATWNRSGSGVVWGGIWLDLAGVEFPELGWQDMVCPVAIGAINATRSLSIPGDTARFPFFDGPLEVELALGADDMIAVHGLWRRRTTVHSNVARSSWVAGLDDCAAIILSAAETRGWSDTPDFTALSKVAVGGSR